MLVTNDLVYDQRVLRHANYLESQGFNLFLVGRLKQTTNTTIPLNFQNKRFKMIFNKSWLFYAEMNIRLTFYLLFRKIDIVWANDLDTLPAAFLISKLRKKHLVYDSHEFFTGVPEMKNKPIIRFFWKKIEATLLHKISSKFTVSDGVASLYKQHYGVEFDVIRNFSSTIDIEERMDLGLPMVDGFSFSDSFFIYQGALNKDRGIECLIEAMGYLNGYKLLLVGSGDIESELVAMVRKKKLSDKVKFAGQVEPAILKLITPKATLGFSIELPSNDNYRFCLPNKLFDYLKAGIPTIAFENIEIKKIFCKYQIGMLVNSHDPKELADKVLGLLNNPLLLIEIKEQILHAQIEFSWEKESRKLSKMIFKTEPS